MPPQTIGYFVTVTPECGLDVLDCLAALHVGRPRKEKYRTAFRYSQKPRFFRCGQAGFHDFFGLHDMNLVDLGKRAVQGSARIESAEQVGAHLKWQMRGLHAHRQGVRHANAAQADHLMLGTKMESFPYFVAGGNSLERNHSRMRLGSPRLHLFAEGENLADVFVELGLGDEGAFSPLAVSDTQTAKRFKRLARGHPADAQALGNYFFGGKWLPGLKSSRADVIEDVLLDLVVERNNTLSVEVEEIHGHAPVV